MTKSSPALRWPEPVYMCVGYVFDSRFSDRTIQPISMIFSVLNMMMELKENFIHFLVGIKTFEISVYI